MCLIFEYNPLPIEESSSSNWKLCKSGKAEAKKAWVLISMMKTLDYVNVRLV